MLLDFIKTTYKPGEPFLLQNLELNIKYDNLCQQIKKLVDDGFLCRYMDGVYYLPKKTITGIPYTLNADMVAELKYVSNKTEEYGCYTGHTLANMLGLSEQVPQVKEIVSNNTSAITRTVKVGKFSYIVRKIIFKESVFREDIVYDPMTKIKKLEVIKKEITPYTPKELNLMFPINDEEKLINLWGSFSKFLVGYIVIHLFQFFGKVSKSYFNERLGIK